MKPKFHKKLPIVLIEAVDHCMDVPVNLNENNMVFNTVGILFAETKNAWYVCSWMFQKRYEDANNEGFMIIKTPGAKLTILGHLNDKE
jgi:hypothetical protein